jgi:hypothetical protein
MEAAPSKPSSRRKFSPEEDQLLSSLVEKYGSRDWAKIASFMEDRTVRQCKERWANYLSQAVDGPLWTAEDDLLLERMVIERGHKWKAFEVHFPGRTDIQLKNRHNVILRRRNRIFRIAFGRNGRDRSERAKIKMDHGDEGVDGIDIEVDWTSEWTGDDCGDPGSCEPWMIGECGGF